jgi:hypothetical protein
MSLVLLLSFGPENRDERGATTTRARKGTLAAENIPNVTINVN